MAKLSKATNTGKKNAFNPVQIETLMKQSAISNMYLEDLDPMGRDVQIAYVAALYGKAPLAYTKTSIQKWGLWLLAKQQAQLGYPISKTAISKLTGLKVP
jgi:hypothetical protein